MAALRQLHPTAYRMRVQTVRRVFGPLLGVLVAALGVVRAAGQGWSIPDTFDTTEADSVQVIANSVVSLDVTVTALSGFLVFFLQVGFISLEVGYTRAKNVRSTLLKNTVDVLIGSLCWWAVGFAFAHGTSAGGGFIGTSRFFQDSPAPYSIPWFFTLTFAISTANIVSGCVAERTALHVYPIITVLITAWVHPLAVHWVWDRAGWLNHVSRCEFLDFAGGTLVHCIGGLTGLVGAIMCGPRIGRFEDGEDKPILGHDMTSVSVGTFILWFGLFGFNCGTVYTYNPVAGFIVDRVALNMTLSASTAGLTALLITSFYSGSFDLCVCCNGLMTGLVAATGSCAYTPPWAAAVIGLVAGVMYIGLSRLLVRLRIDDPLDSSAIHFGGGALGVIMVGFFAKPEFVALLGPEKSSSAFACGGVALSKVDGGLQLGMQMLGVVVICGWALFWAVLAFGTLWFFRMLRVEQATELAGMDNIEHGGPAYPEFLSMQMAHSNNNERPS